MLGDLSPLWVPVSSTLLQMGPSTQLHCGEVRAHFQTAPPPQLYSETPQDQGYSGGSYFPVQKCSVTVLLRAAELAGEVDPTSFHPTMAGRSHQESSEALSDWKRNVIRQTATP